MNKQYYLACRKRNKQQLRWIRKQLVLIDRFFSNTVGPTRIIPQKIYVRGTVLKGDEK